MGLPHYRDARMQRSQRTQPALPGVSTVVAPRECQHPLTECSLHPQRNFRKRQKVQQQDKIIILSKNGPVKPSLQLCAQTVKLIYASTGHNFTINSATLDTYGAVCCEVSQRSRLWWLCDLDLIRDFPMIVVSERKNAMTCYQSSQSERY